MHSCAGFFKAEIVPVLIPQKKGDAKRVDTDEHPRPETTLEMLARLKGVVRPDGTVTAGNASGVNDGACAVLLASEAGAKRHGLKPRARVLGMAVAGLAPRIRGFGPSPATSKALKQRRDRNRASARGLRGAPRGHCPESTRPYGRSLCPMHDVHRCRPRHRSRRRAHLKNDQPETLE
jgi:hypothetical protein